MDDIEADRKNIDVEKVGNHKATLAILRDELLCLYIHAHHEIFRDVVHHHSPAEVFRSVLIKAVIEPVRIVEERGAT